MIKIGSAFSGIGGFELGLERAIPNSETIWQIENNAFCQRILRKHWTKTTIYSDITKLNFETLEKPDILCAGFPCQDYSVASTQKGLQGDKGSLWNNLFQLISILRCKIIVLENTPNIVRLGIPTISAQLSSIGYCLQWTIVSAAEVGAPHLRKRFFGIATNTNCNRNDKENKNNARWTKYNMCTDRKRSSYWTTTNQPSICRMGDGVSNRLDRMKALGNSIVPQCSFLIGQIIYHNLIK